MKSQTNLCYGNKDLHHSLSNQHIFGTFPPISMSEKGLKVGGGTILKTYIKVFKAEISHCYEYKHFLPYNFPTMLEQEGG